MTTAVLQGVPEYDMKGAAALTFPVRQRWNILSIGRFEARLDEKHCGTDCSPQRSEPLLLDPLGQRGRERGGGRVPALRQPRREQHVTPLRQDRLRVELHPLHRL